MTGPQADRRSRTLRAIVTATIDVIVATGADSVTITEIARRAGVSRPTAYSVVGSPSGALAEVWLAHGADWLAGLTAEPHVTSTSVDQHRGVATALCEILMIAGRDNEVSEVVHQDLVRLWRDAAAGGEVALLRSVWLLAAAIGSELSAGLSANLQRGAVALQTVRELTESTLSRPAEANHAPELSIGQVDRTLPDQMGRHGDGTSARLIAAAASVVASTGVAQASMLRICRVAGVTTGAGRPRFTSVEELVLAGFEREIGRVVDTNIGALSTVPGRDFMDTYAEFITLGLAAERRQWRMFRQELHLAARVTPAIHASLERSIGRAEADLAAVINAPPISFSETVSNAALGVNQILSVGLPALHQLGLPVERLDHRIPLHWVYRSVTASG